MNCAGNKVKSLIINDIYSVDVIIFENREWKKFVLREHKDLEKIMKVELDYYLDNDFEVFERLDYSFNQLKITVESIDSLTKEMIKIVKMMKRKKITDLDEVSSKTDLTYRSMIKSELDAILKFKSLYNKNRLKLKSVFKSLDQKLLFIKEETVLFEGTLSELKFKRKEIQVDLDRYMDILNKVLFDDTKSEYSIFIIESSKKIEKWRIQLDLFEKFVENINPIAIKEAKGFVVLKGKDEEPMKYINRYKEGIEKYNLNIENIHKLIQLF